ncbi:type I restriction-modification system subunit M [Salmonella enterica subsp. enterica serovar Ibadan]|uniref:site-specific DNA-methyltransferase (adenine-specific) n=3 Tax=Salmonella TaxID=590 RepID=A0A750HT38_SALER|nr:type I restriction-modification system subunit M [Salmonella enterica]EBV2940592.1 type I restriction-modification system subunit M [Salmonella enterica subsp. enterica serovar Woodhull]EBW4305229.1 type I restriction-modification system subunit M [Salmonella enterica subsp. enterica serovar Duisburg]ECC3389654.1 type I restriction-modification system subunit M [Salmonella enterica subsp. enterica]EAX2647416.1 type I restriction-modification system subunit M [Salmonella enterica]EBO4158873.
MNKQQLAAKIWESANQMRSKIEANEYKDYILGFIFYKYLSDQLVQFVTRQGMTPEDIKALNEEDADIVEYVQSNLGYFIAYDNLFSTWIDPTSEFNESNVRDALSAFSRLISPTYKKLFDGIFTTLETGLSKLGESAGKRTKAISDLLHLIKSIPMNGNLGYDVLGYIYEYLIEKFAANAGKKAGEFYTPHEVSVLISNIIAHELKHKDTIKIYDPTSGSGSLLINIGEAFEKYAKNKDCITYYAQELKANTYNLTRMNLIMRGIKASNIKTRNGDTLEEDWPYFDDSDPQGSYYALHVDAVVSNPPYSQNWDPSFKESDPRYSRFGLAPKTKADFAFLLHDLYHLKPDGIMAIVLPHGVLFRGGEEGEIRKQLIEQNHIDAIIGLPANIFFGTGIPTVILILKQKRQNTDVLVVDASKHFMKEGKNNKLQASDIKRITDAVINRESIDKFSKLVSKQTLRDNGYNLNIPRYVDSSARAESWDLHATMLGGIPNSEIAELDNFWQAFPQLRSTLFTPKSAAYSKLGIVKQDVNTSISGHPQVIEFISAYNQAFNGFDNHLNAQLIENWESVKRNQQESVLSAELFARLAPIALIDKYQAYQYLNNQWQLISADLEMMQTEGFAATRQVDPNFVIKKKNGQDTEVQDGWKGHILPFDLVQQIYLSDDLRALAAKESRLSEITSTLEEILESLTEEEKEQDTVKETKDSFANAEVGKAAKAFMKEQKDSKVKFAEESYEAKIIRANELIDEEKILKKTVKDAATTLHLQTKTTIETLTDEQVNNLLHLKWIAPLSTELAAMPNAVISQLTSQVQALADKYAVTYPQVANEIKTTELELADMMGKLTGNEFDMQGLAELTNLLKGK